jgi:hypothetical protein
MAGNTFQQSVTTSTAVRIASFPSNGRGGTVIVTNPSTTNGIFLGSTSGVTTTSGLQLNGPGGSLSTISIPLSGELWAIASVGTQTISVGTFSVDT